MKDLDLIPGVPEVYQTEDGYRISREHSLYNGNPVTYCWVLRNPDDQKIDHDWNLHDLAERNDMSIKYGDTETVPTDVTSDPVADIALHVKQLLINARLLVSKMPTSKQRLDAYNLLSAATDVVYRPVNRTVIHVVGKWNQHTRKCEYLSVHPSLEEGKNWIEAHEAERKAIQDYSRRFVFPMYTYKFKGNWYRVNATPLPKFLQQHLESLNEV